MTTQSDTKKLITLHQRRLQKLKEQQSIRGLNTPPEILIEIEEIEAQIRQLEIESGAYDVSSDIEGHPNISFLLDRANTLLEKEDYAGVVHACGSIFETLVRDVLNPPSRKDKFYDLMKEYREISTLPTEILDYVHEVYRQRNRTPLAAHGSTELPDISRQEAVMLIDLVKVIIKAEY